MGHATDGDERAWPTGRVKITMDGPKGSLAIDGVDISNLVESFHVSGRGGELPRLELVLVPRAIELDADVQAIIERYGATE